MEFSKIFELLKQYYLIVIVILGYFVQISPIHIYPAEWIKKLVQKIFSFIREQITLDLNQSIQDLNQNITDLDSRMAEKTKKDDEDRIKDLRWRILNFAENVEKSPVRRETFDQIYESYQDYEDLVEKYGYTNGRVDRAMKKIDKYYDIYENTYAHF